MMEDEIKTTLIACIDARLQEIHKSTMAEWRKVDEYYLVFNLCNELDLDEKAREIESDIKSMS